MNPRLTALRAEFDKLRSGITTIEQKAATEGRDITDKEQADLDQLFARAEEIRPTIEAEADKQRSLEATADVLSRLGMTQPAPAAARKVETPLPTVGEYLAAFNRGLRGDTEAQEFCRSFAEEHSRAAATQALADNAGVVPSLILGDLIKFVDPSRPALNSFTRRPMWTGTGNRPRVTQSTSVAVQAAEFAELASQKMTIVKDALTRGTYGGYVEISEQDAEFTDPGMMQIIMEDLAEQYGVTTGNVAADAFVTAASNTYELTGAAGAITGVTNDNLTAGLWGAAAQVHTQCKKLPDTMWCSVDIWANLGARVDTTGRPLYPNLAPSNASGTMVGVGDFNGRPLNLPLVVDPNFASGTLVVGVARLAEVYEMIKGTAVGAFNVGTLSTQVGYRGYLGTYFRAEGFAKLINAA